jgi:N-acetylmuramoyl-L-alanine amidase
MNKSLKIIVAIIVFMIAIGTTNYGRERILIYEGVEHVYTAKDVTIDVNNDPIQPDGMAPVIINGRTLVPVREVMESVNIQAQVSWLAETQTVVIAREDIKIELRIGDSYAYVNGQTIELDVPPILISDQAVGVTKTMVPIRFITESLGYEVLWEPDTYHISLQGEIYDEFGLLASTSNLVELIPTIEIPELPTALRENSIHVKKEIPQEIVEFTGYKDSFDYPLTEIIEVSSNEDESKHYIKAASSMSSVNAVIWDNKLIVDINGADMEAVPGTIRTDKSLYTDAIRTSQYDEEKMTGRFVFDLKEKTIARDIILNRDRTEIEISFNEVGLSEIIIAQDRQGDYIELAGDYRNAMIMRMDTPKGLIFDFANSINLIGNQRFMNIDGQFLDWVKLAQKDDSTIRLSVGTGEHVDYSIEYDEEDNQTRIVFEPLFFEQLTYDKSKNDAVVLPKEAGIALSYDYFNKEAVIRYDKVINSIRDDEVIHIHDTKYDTIELLVENNASLVRLHGKHIYEHTIEEDENFYYIYGTKPKDIYDHIVVLDPGHGGYQPGAVYYGINEKDLNMKLMEYIYPYTESNTDIKYYFTRTTDVAVSLGQRTTLANDLEADLFVSMHNNALDLKSNPAGVHVRGLEVYTTTGWEKSATEVEFGKIFLEKLRQAMPNYPVRAIKNNNKLYVLRNTEMPSIILEYGYMTNPDDIALLQQDAILEQLAEVTEKAIYEYIMNK